jgi:hypothetical protein
MSLPFVLDVALGLMFIYLIFSLLASEIQELLTTVFQWRAQHLKKSIEIMLAGGAENAEDKEVIQLANRIYNNPLIKSINQEATGSLVTLPRKMTWAIGSLYNSLTKSKTKLRKGNVFGNQQHSAPSYISADTFAATVMDVLQIPTVVQKLSESRFNNFKDQKLAEIKNILQRLQTHPQANDLFGDFLKEMITEFVKLKGDFDEIVEDFKKNKIDITMSLNLLRNSLNTYILIFESDMVKDQEVLEKALRTLKLLEKNSFANIEQTILLEGLRPNINEVVKSIDTSTAIYQEVAEVLKNQDKYTDGENNITVQDLINNLPKSVVDNITVMAKRAQLKAKTTEEGINILRQEIENSFDSSMERASGVYKRNAKGVALFIGFALAISANADTFHIISRLSQDSVLRTSLINRAELISPDKTNLSDLKNQNFNEIIRDDYLPIGWTDAHLKEQLNWNSWKIKGFPVFSVLKMILGWLISGIAIAMGAPFWFDLLGKFVNVRNAGKPPKQQSEEN